MSATHTRGPWTASHTWTGIITIDDAVGHRVATIEKHGRGTHANGIEGAGANARLIAAAPDMLAALKLIESHARFKLQAFAEHFEEWAPERKEIEATWRPVLDAITKTEEAA